MSNKKLRVITYARVSSKEQVDGYSLDAQRDDCQAWAEERGFEVVQVLTEPGLSAKTDKRPVFQAMIRTVLAGGADAILIHKSDRIARNLLNLLTLHSKLKQADKKIFSVLEPFFNDDSPENLLVCYIVAAINEYFLANLSRETLKGLNKKASSGDFPGGTVTLGYHRIDKRTICIDEEKGPMMKTAFHEFATGKYTLLSWAKKSIELGISNKKGKPIQAQTWQKMFRNLFYVGQFYWREEYYEGNHSALIDIETFNAVQAILNKRNTGKQQKHFWLLSGLIWSKTHHAKMSGTKTSKGYAYYRASGNGPEHSIPAAELEERVIAKLADIRHMGDVEGYTKRAPKSLHLAMQVTESMAKIWPFMKTPQEKHDFLRLIFGIILVDPGGAVVDFTLNPGFESL